MVAAEKLETIQKKAEALVGEPLGEYGEDLTGIAVALACAWCNREDIPEDMEDAVALMAAALAGERSAIKTIKRGDTSVTYDTDGGALGLPVVSFLAPWRRLGRLKEDAK